ncbi:hypothetical protein X474_15305 [Dethiosulfatarculus sandiegensis]|uniref:Uncharacterized protein n=1 Tax=Dethiosulfatarculus sandiegensis TaxID=1429043 RepID=A0A0D2HRF1_9BACT|nr:hypothetical protein X474_15305 [Dethiosulfatarculus sandiegensis]
MVLSFMAVKADQENFLFIWLNSGAYGEQFGSGPGQARSLEFLSGLSCARP